MFANLITYLSRYSYLTNRVDNPRAITEFKRRCPKRHFDARNFYILRTTRWRQPWEATDIFSTALLACTLCIFRIINCDLRWVMNRNLRKCGLIHINIIMINMTDKCVCILSIVRGILCRHRLRFITKFHKYAYWIIALTYICDIHIINISIETDKVCPVI